MTFITLTTAAQIGVIKSQKPPAFAKGTKNAPEGMALVGEEGPELVHLSKGSKVINAPETKKILDKYNVPNVTYNEVMKDSNGVPMIGIDPDAIGKAVAREMSKNPSVHMNVDQNGFMTYVIKGRDKNIIVNKRYNA